MINEKIENIADNILYELNIKTPKGIKLEKIAKHLGVDIKGEGLDFDVSGLFLMKNDKYYIRYNVTESEQRQRFTIAHELGHFILHKEDKPLFVDKSEKILYRNFNSSTGEIKKEREANAFAAALLMPRFLLSQLINKAPNNVDHVINYLATEFNVSEQAMSFRLSNLGYLNNNY